MAEKKPLIKAHGCSVRKGGATVLAPFSWEMRTGETWLVTGPNGGGKEHFVEALAAGRGFAEFTPAGDGSLYSNVFSGSVSLVSLEAAAALIAEERENDDGDYAEDGIDIGRTAREFVAEVAGLDGAQLERTEEARLCGISPVLDRGLKYLSTGEIRRVLLCRALLSKKKLVVLSNPFAGLDAGSRRILRDFFSRLATAGENSPALVLSMERFSELPDGITNVLEFTGGKLSFCGAVREYERRLAHDAEKTSGEIKSGRQAVRRTFTELHAERKILVEGIGTSSSSAAQEAGGGSASAELVRMRNVTVAWGGNVVLDNLSWTLRAGEHWLIRGPNGSGKTTFLELITGDNMQVFSNDVSVFGRRRGSGETVWELKERMGIVSYRMHIEYRMLGGTDLEAVLLSGLHDTIGLYRQRSQVEQLAVRRWLALGGFSGRGGTPFGSLSYGEQRAVLILRAVVKCPELLVLDEPCHGLDDAHRARVLALLEAIAETGSTTLLHVTHDPSEVLPCERHILELRPGEKPMYRIVVRD